MLISDSEGNGEINKEGEVEKEELLEKINTLILLSISMCLCVDCNQLKSNCQSPGNIDKSELFSFKSEWNSKLQQVQIDFFTYSQKKVADLTFVITNSLNHIIGSYLD